MVGQRPISKWRSGNIEAALWLNSRKLGDGTEVGFKTVSLSRSYKKKGEEIWRNDSIPLRRNDIVKVLVVLQEAQKELLLNAEKEEGEEDE